MTAEISDEIELLQAANGAYRKMIRINIERINDLQAQLDTLRAENTDQSWKDRAQEMSPHALWNTFGSKTTYATQTKQFGAVVFQKSLKGFPYLRISERGDVTRNMSRTTLFNIYRQAPSGWASLYDNSS